jgi:ABC-2 type transport system ATP-binding protein
MNHVEPGLRCESVTRAFENSQHGVFDVTLSIPQGTVYALLGGNGAGKTTLINLCLGLLQPDRGAIYVVGIDIAQHATDAKRRLAYVPEVARLYAHLNALENIRFFEELNGRHASDDEIEGALATLSFPPASIRQPSGIYSKGMRQKVVIAMGLIKAADLFLLDEPSTGLDPASSRQLIRIIERLRDDGRTVLISTHESHNVCSYADRVGILRDGRLITDAPSSTLDSQTIDDLTENTVRA